MALQLGPGFNIQVAASSLLVFSNPDPNAYAFARLWETALGAVVTVILAPLLFPPNTTSPIKAKIEPDHCPRCSVRPGSRSNTTRYGAATGCRCSSRNRSLTWPYH